MRQTSITNIPGLMVMAVLPLYAQPHPAMLRELYEQHLAEQAKEHGENDARTGGAARDLGLFLRSHGDLAGASAALSRAVAIEEKVLGMDAPRTLADVADLASVAPAADAPKLFERAATSSDPAAASRALVALGEMHASQGDRHGAARYWRQALVKQEAAGGANSETAARILNVLAQVVDPADALPLLQRAVILDRKRFGPTHPEVGATDQLLAATLVVLEKPAEAVAPAREAVSIFTQKLGADHPRTAASVVVLADVLRANRKFVESERSYRQAISAYEKVFSPQHPATLAAIGSLAQMLRAQGRIPEAVILERRLVVNVAR